MLPNTEIKSCYPIQRSLSQCRFILLLACSSMYAVPCILFQDSVLPTYWVTAWIIYSFVFPCPIPHKHSPLLYSQLSVYTFNLRQIKRKMTAVLLLKSRVLMSLLKMVSNTRVISFTSDNYHLICCIFAFLISIELFGWHTLFAYPELSRVSACWCSLVISATLWCVFLHCLILMK